MFPFQSFSSQDRIVMIDIVNIDKIQDQLNIPSDKVVCMSCSESGKKMYVIKLKNNYGENILPICKECLERLELGIELEKKDD